MLVGAPGCISTGFSEWMETLGIKLNVGMFSRNPIYPLPREGFFTHISVATITMFPDTSLISSN